MCMLISLPADISAQDHILEKSEQMLIRMMFDMTAVCTVPGLSGEEDLVDQYHNDKTPEHSNSNHKKWNPTDFDTFGGYK